MATSIEKSVEESVQTVVQQGTEDAERNQIVDYKVGRTPVPARFHLRGYTRDQLQDLVEEEFGEKRFRGKQLFKWIHQKGARTFGEMTSISKDFRATLADGAALSSIEPDKAYDTADGTTKMTFKLADGAVVESVIIPADGRVTICISSQVGCAINCQFCLTAKMGLVRNLTAAEIVDQVAWAKQLWEPVHERRISNIVFMGMGEPLHNVEQVMQALRILLDREGLDFSRRKITVSTSGLVPAIEKLGEQEDIGVNLAISLNATTNEVRDQVMPINKRWNIETLLDALSRYPVRPRQLITFEYVMLGGVNDTPADARRLHKLLQPLPSKVNLIPWNPFDGVDYERPERKDVLAFQQQLHDLGVNATVRVTRGLEAMAACGQLGQPGKADTWRDTIREARKKARQGSSPASPSSGSAEA